MLVVKEVQKGVYGFENFTLCPYDTNLIDMELLTKQDVEFINAYHKKVWETISPHLQNDKLTL